MTNFLPPLGEQFGAQQADLLRRIATLEQQFNHLTSLNGVALSGTPSTGQVPTATSSTAATWQTPSSGAMTLLDHQLLTSTAASVTITLGSTYNRIKVIYRANVSTGSNQDMYLTVDGSGGANYTWAKTSGNAGGTSTTAANINDTHAKCGVLSSQSPGAYFGVGEITFTGWNSTSSNLNWVENSIGFAVGLMWTEIYGGMYTGGFGSHTTLTFAPATNLFSAGTEFTTYGLS